MSDRFEELVDSLLYEGYALYPYTPSATKNATPTPFGIVYPPAYARTLDAAFDHLELQGVLHAGPGARVLAELRFLAPSGPRHEAQPQRIELPPVSAAALARGIAVEHERELPALLVRLALSGEPAGPDTLRVTLRVENRTAVDDDLDRAGALRHALLSAHPVLHAPGGRFASPLHGGCTSANTWPVLATDDEDVLLGTAIVLPDHPQLAPESRGSLFDATEIEEALLLHVHALSEAERAEIAQQDPAVREMLARALAATPEDLLALHGRVTLRDPDPLTSAPPIPSPSLPDPAGGEDEATSGGVTFRRGAHVVLHPPASADLHARMLAGRRATVERIYVDDGGRVHLGVTVDDEPGRELLRETGRFLYFFPDEVEVTPCGRS